MAVDDLYKVTICCSTVGGPFTWSVFYKMISGTIESGSLDALAIDWQTDHLIELQNMLSDSCFIEEVRVDPEPGVNEVPGFDNKDSVNGNIAFGPMPNNVAAVISELTDAPNSNANGRIFIAGIPESAMEDGIFSVAYTALVQLLADSLEGNLIIAAPAAAEFTPVVVSRYLSGSLRIPPVPHDIVSNTAKRQARQQRRRTTRALGLS